MMFVRSFRLEFMLQGTTATTHAVRESLAEVADSLFIEEVPADNESKSLRITTTTSDPTLIFDVAAQFGRLGSVKIDEVES